MEMTLEVVSFQKSLMGDAHAHTFDESGGSIGRSRDSTWVLPDPNRYVSSRHAEITYVDGHFRIVDTSTNGVFVNDDAAALGRDGHADLSDGDRLMIGDYEIAVRIAARATRPPASEPSRPSPVFKQQPPADILEVVGRRREPRLASHAFDDAPQKQGMQDLSGPNPPGAPSTTIPDDFAEPKAPAEASVIPDDEDFGLGAARPTPSPSRRPVSPPPIGPASPAPPPPLRAAPPPPRPAPRPAPPTQAAPPPAPQPPAAVPRLPDDLDDLLPVPGEHQSAPADILPPGVPLLDPVPGTGNRQEPLSPSAVAPSSPPAAEKTREAPPPAPPSAASPPGPSPLPRPVTAGSAPDALPGSFAGGLGLDAAALDGLDTAAVMESVARAARAAALGISGAFDARNALARAAGVDLETLDQDDRNPFLTFRSGEAALKRSLQSDGSDTLRLEAATEASVVALTASSLAAAAALDVLFDHLAAADAPPSADELREIFGTAFLNAYHRESRRLS